MQQQQKMQQQQMQQQAQFQQMQVPQQQMQVPQMPQMPQMPPGVQPFAAPAQQPKDVSAIFQSLGIDTNPQAARQPPLNGQQPGFPGMTSMPLAGFPTGLNPVSAMSAAAMSAPPAGVQQAFGNGLGGPAAMPSGAPQPGQSLMGLLQTPAGNAGLNSGAFAPLGNGAPACGSRAQAAFAPPAPQCQLQQSSVMSGSNAFAPPNHAFASSSRGPPMQSRQAPAPKALSSASDYANAAVNYKPPPTRAVASSTSISRKPEVSSKMTSQPSAQKEEWECPRCTFLNNSALWECEMCGFERAGKEEPSEPPEDAGWAIATNSVRKSVPVASDSLAGKSKAQNKNEKRRAKKRGEP